MKKNSTSIKILRMFKRKNPEEYAKFAKGVKERQRGIDHDRFSEIAKMNNEVIKQHRLAVCYDIQPHLLMLESLGYRIIAMYPGNIFYDELTDHVKFSAGHIQLRGLYNLPEIPTGNESTLVNIIKTDIDTAIEWHICDMKQPPIDKIDELTYQSKGYGRMSMIKGALMGSLYTYISKLGPPSSYEDISS